MPFIDDLEYLDRYARAEADRPRRLRPEDRYRSDPTFRALVDMIRHVLHDMPEITPTELREAVMLAATIHESLTIRPILITDPEIARQVRDHGKFHPHKSD